jgi:hypothetical protein
MGSKSQKEVTIDAPEAVSFIHGFFLKYQEDIGYT